MNIVVMDMGSRLNLTGGQARFAVTLHNYFVQKDNSYYLGYETEYIKQGEKNAIILPRSSVINPNLRRSKLSEMTPFRLAYNFFVIRQMHSIGISRDDLLAKIKGAQPDVIISNSIQDMPVIRYLKSKGMQFKIVYIDHTCISNTHYTYFSKEGIPLTVGCGVTAFSVDGAKRKFFRFFDMNIALNLAQERIIKAYTDKVTRISVGVNRPQRNPQKEDELRKRYRIPRGKFVVLYTGRMFERQKNVSTLIDAFVHANLDSVLLLVGDGPSLEDYKRLAAGNPKIIFTGMVSEADFPSFYDLADLFVLPSKWEGFSRTVLEAASHGLPIILSDGAYIEDLKERDLGRMHTFTTGSVAQLASSITTMVKNHDYRRMAASVSEDIAKRFDEQLMLEQYRNVVLRLLSKR